MVAYDPKAMEEFSKLYSEVECVDVDAVMKVMPF